MKKIIGGFLMLVVSLGATAGIAYAAYSSSINLNNVSFTLDTAPDLKISLDGGSNWQFGTVDLVSSVLTGLKPGDTVTIPIWLWNSGTTGQVTYKLSAQLVSASSGDWDNLSPLISVKFGTSGPSGTLAAWYAGPSDLGVILAPGEWAKEDITITLSSSTDSTVAGLSLVTDWVLTGTQTP